jgi:hypothetical protein
MPKYPQLTESITFVSGVNNQAEANLIPNDKAVTLQNAEISTQGVMKRLGSNTVLNDPGGNAVVGLHYLKVSQTDERMIQVQSTNIYDSTLPLATSGSWVERGSSKVTADQHSTALITAENRLYGSNGKDKVWYHNGSGIIQESDENVDPPFGRVMAYMKNRLWIANVHRRATSIGDTDTYIATDGDKIKITIDDTVFDDIVLTGDNSIADAVASINAATGFSAVGIAWQDTDGYLRVSSLTTGSTSRVRIADGSTGNGGECEDLFNGASKDTDGATDDGVQGADLDDYVYYSNVLATETFARSTQLFQVSSGDSTEVMAMVPYANSVLVIFKETSVHQLTMAGATATYWNLGLVKSGIGCVAYDCAKEHVGIIYFLSYSGVYAYADGTISPVSLSVEAETEINSINWDYVNRSRMIIWDDKVFLAIPTGTSTYPDRVLVYDIQSKGWYIIKGWNVGCWGVFLERTAGSTSAFEEALMYGDSNDGYVYHCFKSTQFNDGSTAIDFDWITKRFDHGDEKQEKIGDTLRVVIGSSTGNTLDIDYKKDRASSWSDLTTITASSTINLKGLGRYKDIQFRLRHNDTSTEQLIINQVVLKAHAARYRRE